jgi:hypothetical protein
MDGAHAGCLPAVANTDIVDEGPFRTFIINSRITAIGDPKRRVQTVVGWCHCSTMRRSC